MDTTSGGLSLSILHTIHMCTKCSVLCHYLFFTHYTSIQQVVGCHYLFFTHYTCIQQIVACHYLVSMHYTCIHVEVSVFIYSSHPTHVYMLCPLSLSILHTLHMHTTCRGLCHNLFFTHYTCIQHFMSSVTIYSSSSTHVLWRCICSNPTSTS